MGVFCDELLPEHGNAHDRSHDREKEQQKDERSEYQYGQELEQKPHVRTCLSINSTGQFARFSRRRSPRGVGARDMAKIWLKTAELC